MLGLLPRGGLGGAWRGFDSAVVARAAVVGQREGCRRGCRQAALQEVATAQCCGAVRLARGISWLVMDCLLVC